MDTQTETEQSVEVAAPKPLDIKPNTPESALDKPAKKPRKPYTKKPKSALPPTKNDAFDVSAIVTRAKTMEPAFATLATYLHAMLAGMLKTNAVGLLGNEAQELGGGLSLIVAVLVPDLSERTLLLGMGISAIASVEGAVAARVNRERTSKIALESPQATAPQEAVGTPPNIEGIV